MMVRAARTLGSVVDWASATHCAAVSLNSSARSLMAGFPDQWWWGLSVHLREVRRVIHSLRPGGRSRIAVRFRDGRPRGDRYEHRHDENRDEGNDDSVRFRCHVSLLGSDSEVGLYRQVEETSVMPVTLWSYRRKL